MACHQLSLWSCGRGWRKWCPRETGREPHLHAGAPLHVVCTIEYVDHSCQPQTQAVTDILMFIQKMLARLTGGCIFCLADECHCCSCRDLCQITPTKLVLVEEHDYEEALQWTVGRWAAIKQLAYVQTHTAVNEPADVAFAHGDVIIPVHQLQVALGNENLHWSDWIPALLSRVPVLWSLKINIQRCPALPLLPQLQHLWLDVEQDSPGLVPSLLQLETLQSLWLGRQRFQAAQAAEQAHVAVALVAPGAAAAPMAAVAAEDALILSPSVQHIVLKDALPAVLMLSNPACTISLLSGVDDIATALHAWAEAGGHDAAQIKSIEVVAADEALELMDLEQALHPLLHNLPHLLYMKIQTPSPPPPPNQPPNYDGLYLHNSLRYAPLDNLTSLIVQVRTSSHARFGFLLPQPTVRCVPASDQFVIGVTEWENHFLHALR